MDIKLTSYALETSWNYFSQKGMSENASGAPLISVEISLEARTPNSQMFLVLAPREHMCTLFQRIALSC